MSDDRALALVSRHPLTDRWNLPGEVRIERVLVLDTAQQPPARAGDPQRIRWQVLQLRHPQGDRFEVFEEGGAAQIPAAAAKAAGQPRSVTGADLAEIDPGSEATSQLPTSARKSTRWGALK